LCAYEIELPQGLGLL